MCGIFGYFGPRTAYPLLLNGLRRLEYRGYDSAGISTLAEGLQTIKAVGKVENLAGALAADPPAGNVGIAHTRWATHGVPSVQNAHPHRDCQGEIALVHNGIIDNLAELDRIAVLPELRGRGIAAALFQTLLADADAHYRRHGHFLRKLFLMTHADNLRAQAFYRKMGFAAEATLRDHFYQGKNEIVMSLFRTRENQ